MIYRTDSFVHDGHRLVYDVYGDDGPVLVYLHGLMIDSEINRGIADAVAGRGHRVVLLDLLGHGRSDKPTFASEYRMDTYAGQVIGLLDHLGEPSVALGGMSLGANVSLFAASMHPSRIRGLVIEMPVLEWAVPSAALLFTPLLLLAHYGQPVLQATSRLIRRVPVTPWAPLNSLLHGASMDPEAMAAVLHGILVGPVAPTIEQRRAIQAPALVLAHGKDLIHPFGDAENLAAQLPNSTLVEAHSPFELRLHPERLTEVIGEFLDELQPPVRRVG